MKKLDFTTPYYDYKVTLLQEEGKDDANPICQYLKSNKLGDDVIEDVKYNIENGYVDGGETNWNQSTKRIIVIFYTFTSDSKMAEVFSHEKRHIEDRILQHCKVDDIEAAWYLAGFFGVKFYKFWNMLKSK